MVVFTFIIMSFGYIYSRVQLYLLKLDNSQTCDQWENTKMCPYMTGVPYS